jgi:hypothetical protein
MSKSFCLAVLIVFLLFILCACRVVSCNVQFRHFGGCFSRTSVLSVYYCLVLSWAWSWVLDLGRGRGRGSWCLGLLNPNLNKPLTMNQQDRWISRERYHGTMEPRYGVCCIFHLASCLVCCHSVCLIWLLSSVSFIFASSLLSALSICLPFVSCLTLHSLFLFRCLMLSPSLPLSSWCLFVNMFASLGSI